MQECHLLIIQSILYYIGCTNGCICSSDIPAGLVSICLVSTSWVNSANHSHDDKCSVLPIHRLNPCRLEVAAVVISSWWFHLGDFALVISTSIRRYSESVEKSTKRSSNLCTDNASDVLAMNTTKSDNVGRFPYCVPYLDTMEQLRKEFGIKPD